MGKPVSPGQALQILSVFALNTDWSQFDAEDLQRRFVNRPKQSGAAFTAFLMQGITFALAIGGNRSADELFAAGSYVHVSPYAYQFVLGKKFRLAREVEKIDIVLVEFGRDVISSRALDEFVRQGLKCPTEEDALRFGEQYPDEQMKNPIVFLHEPWETPEGRHSVLILNSDRGSRSLSLSPFGDTWGESCRFAARRPRK